MTTPRPEEGAPELAEIAEWHRAQARMHRSFAELCERSLHATDYVDEADERKAEAAWHEAVAYRLAALAASEE